MNEKIIYKRPRGIIDGAVKGFCPGCLHSAAIKTVLEALDELGQTENAVWIEWIGCGGLAVNYMNLDSIAAPHGRACAVQTMHA